MKQALFGGFIWRNKGKKKKKKGKPCFKNKMEGLTLRDTNVNTYPKTVMIKKVRNRQRDRQTDNDTA